MAEVQDIFNRFGDAYMEQAKPPPHVCRVIRAIRHCRTSALGGHVEVCDECGHMKISYNSCRNRHCPKCQALTKERWIMARETDLLPVPYFHVVFTLPEELSMVAFQNQKAVYNILLKTSWETLQELCGNPKYLGAEIGAISILHTWGQQLTLHPHVHMIVPGGGLTQTGQWRNSRKKFFIPVKVMAKLFRGKFLHALRQMELGRRGKLEPLSIPANWNGLIDTLYQKDWYVYCKKPFQNTHSVLAYLGRYTHRVAISNHRILGMRDGTVSFRWRDYHDGSKEKQMTLAAHEFMRRFLLHVLPTGFTKIRHYGILASAVKKKKLAICKRLTGVKPSIRETLSTVELMKKVTGKDITVCQYCGIGHWVMFSGLSPPGIG